MGRKNNRQPQRNKPENQQSASRLTALQVVLGSISTVAVAIIGLLGTKFVVERPIMATETAEARLRQITLLATIAPTETLTLPTLPSTVAPTSTSTPTPACLAYQQEVDSDTMINLIMAEAQAVNTKNIEIIKAIFDPKATLQDRDETPETWYDPVGRYTKLFNEASFTGAEHFDIKQVGSTFFVSGSRGTINGSWYSNLGRSNSPPPYGSDHWTFQKNSTDCWVIIRFEFNAGHVLFPP